MRASVRRLIVSAMFMVLVRSVSGQTVIDESPHQIRTVSVEDISVPYLDWGGAGVALVFIPGFSNSAHVFDDFAPRFAGSYRVLGVTRVGFGESDQPEDRGYDLGSRVEHIRAALDSAHIQKAVLIGHSLGGDEITAFAVKYPKRTIAVVYLDAAIDHSGVMDIERILGDVGRAAPSPTETEMASATGILDYIPAEERFSVPARGATGYPQFRQCRTGHRVTCSASPTFSQVLPRPSSRKLGCQRSPCMGI